MINDGLLFDISDLAKEYGFKTPVAITCAVWSACTQWDSAPSEERRIRYEQWNTIDILMALAQCIQSSKQSWPQIWFTAALTIRKGEGGESQWVRLKATIEKDDDGEFAMTIMWPDED